MAAPTPEKHEIPGEPDNKLKAYLKKLSMLTKGMASDNISLKLHIDGPNVPLP